VTGFGPLCGPPDDARRCGVNRPKFREINRPSFSDPKNLDNSLI
jgi:hypothetical protein